MLAPCCVRRLLRAIDSTHLWDTRATSTTTTSALVTCRVELSCQQNWQWKEAQLAGVLHPRVRAAQRGLDDQ